VKGIKVAIEPQSIRSASGKTEEQWSLKNDNLRQVKIAIAALAACLVDALKESDPLITQKFVARLDAAREKFRNNSDADPQQVLDVLHWATEMLNGWNPVPGQDGPVFVVDAAGSHVSDA
jgi:hypothetical protein